VKLRYSLEHLVAMFFPFTFELPSICADNKVIHGDLTSGIELIMVDVHSLHMVRNLNLCALCQCCTCGLSTVLAETTNRVIAGLLTKPESIPAKLTYVSDSRQTMVVVCESVMQQS
jgi:hypothetical protein